MSTSIFHPLYYVINPLGETVTARAHGLDVSKYDESFNPANATTQLDFVAQRSSYRLTKDQAFETIWQGVKDVPIRIAYHYYNFGYPGDGTWQDQVTFMLNVIKGKDFHATAWDYEGAFNVMTVQSAVNSYYAIQELEQRTGKPSMLYTSLGLYNQWIYPTIKTHGLNWNSVNLWLAQWFFTPNPNGSPSRPLGRTMEKYWDLWQYTDKGKDMGTGRGYPTDLDVFNGTVSEMKAKLNIGGVVTPPPPGDKMFYKCIKDVSIRNNTNYPNNSVIGVLKVGDIVEGEMLMNVNPTIPNWVHFSKVFRADGSVETFDGYSSGHTTYLQETTDPNPPPVGEPAVMEIMLADGSSVIVRDLAGSELFRWP